MLALTANAQQGDCNSDGIVDINDMNYLINYLFMSGPPPNLVLCDCDFYPGVNYGDLWQLTEALFGAAMLYPSPGTDVPVPTNVKFLALGNPDGIVQTTATIVVDAPVAIDCVVLPYSFASGVGEAVLNCTSVNFTGSVGTNLTATIDNVNKVFVISNNAKPSIPATPNWRLFATANFTQVAPGTGVMITPTSTATLFPMLLAQAAYAGINMIRVLFPVLVPFSLMNVGDVNCDGQIDIDDIVYLVNFIFMGGPPPGDPDNDGIPNC
jgi:hypothetical protein